MKVLLVNLYFPPDTSATAGVFSDLARALVEKGHDPIVICGRPSYDTRSRGDEDPIAGGTIERVWSTSFDRRIMVGRILNYISFMVSSQLKVVQRRYRVDAVVVGTDPPLAVRAALRLARGAPTVYSLQDLHPEAALVAGWIRPGVRSRFWEWLHRGALRRVDAVVAIGHDMAERLAAKGVLRSRISVIPNGAHRPTSDPDGAVVAHIRRGRSFVVIHAGNMGAIGAWSTLLEAGRALDGVADLVFIGAGVEADKIRATGAEVQPFRPESELSAVMAAGDLHIVTMAPGMEGISVPSKLYTILAHGRPVLAVVPRASEVARVVEQFGCGYVADPSQPDSVVSAVRHARAHADSLREMAEAAERAGLQFDRRRCMQEFVDVVERVIAARAASRV